MQYSNVSVVDGVKGGVDTLPSQLCRFRHRVAPSSFHFSIHLHLRHLADTPNRSDLLYMQEWSESKGLELQTLEAAESKERLKKQESRLEKDKNH